MNEVDKISTVASNMPNEQYHAHPAIGSTSLKEAVKSMAHFRAAMCGLKKVEGSAIDIGSAAHSAVLEKNVSIFQEVDLDRRGTKKWKEKQEEHEGKILLKLDEYSSIKGMYDEFFNHELAPKIMQGGVAEESFFCTDEKTGLLLKARTDYYTQSDAGDYIIDYKTTTNASPEAFSKKIYDLGYHISAAYYMKVVKQVTKRPVKDFIWVVQETSAPFGVRIYSANAMMLEDANRQVNELLGDIAQCQKLDKYPCYPTQIQSIELPAWAQRKEAK